MKSTAQRLINLQKLGYFSRRVYWRHQGSDGNYGTIRKQTKLCERQLNQQANISFPSQGCANTGTQQGIWRKFYFHLEALKGLFTNMRYFKDRPEAEEASCASSHTMDGKNYDVMNDKLNAVLVRNLKYFLGTARRQHRDVYRGGGKLKVEDKNAYDVVMAEISGGEMTHDNTERHIYLKIQVSY